MSALGLVALLAGCSCGPGPESQPPEESGESGDSRDSGAHGPAVQLTLVVPEDAHFEGAATVSLVHVSFGDGPAIGQTIASVETSELEPSLLLPSAAPAELVTALEGSGELTGALFALVVHRDSNADGAWREGEPLLGIAMDRWLLWLASTCNVCDTANVTDEWRVVDLGIAGQYEPNRCALDTSWPMEWMSDQGYPLDHPLDQAIELPLRGLEADLQIQGSISGLVRDDLRLGVLPYPHLGEGEVVPQLDQQLEPAQADFQASLSAEPPSEDDVGADPDWRYTMHLLLPFADSDGSGGWSLGDELEGSSTCLGGELAWARYTRAVDSYRGYRFLDCYSGTVGWRPAHYAEHGGIEYLSSEQGRGLVLDFTDCRLD